MIEIIILGTACMQPTKERNHIGILLRFGKENLLFDCGENIQRQLRIANIKPTKITRLFISHWHGDHVLGIPGLLNSMGADQSSQTLKIYGPKGTKKYMGYMLKAFLSSQAADYEVVELGPSEKLEFGEFEIEARELSHGVPCLGYAFQEKARRKIKGQYINKIPGILLGKLQKGQAVSYQNKRIGPEEATYLIEGKKVSVIMDTRPCDNFIKLAEKADLLISEATFLQEHKEKAEGYNHLTAEEVGLLANQAQVKRLVLLHFSQRYKDLGEIRKEVKMVFKEAICAEDFMRFKV